MKTQLLLVSFVLLVGASCKRAPETPAQPTNPPSASGNPVTAPVDYLGAVAQAKKFSEKAINLAALNNAIQQFNAMEERFPKDLNELVEKRYLANLPIAPAGMRLAYNPQSGEVRILKQP